MIRNPTLNWASRCQIIEVNKVVETRAILGLYIGRLINKTNSGS